jgi:hypothetical protein
LEVEVTNVSRHGLWLLLGDRELFLPFDKFPWFRHAPIAKLVHVQPPSPDHLYWPDLDVRLRSGTIRRAELHWYEAHGISRKEIKRKQYAD